MKYCYSDEEISSLSKTYSAEVVDATNDDIIDLITNKNIVSIFQGASEAGPRALGNRSILYDPTDPDGKDHVNEIKRREYFRPFAGSILEEDVHEWFDLRGMESSPTMMYAVNCQPGVEEKIPAIIHVDGTCRIQTVNREQNPHYYDIIKAFKERTGCPIIFNTSFNLGGEPLVETLDDALWTLQESDIEYLYLPEYGKLLSIKNA
jgi:carbamoyltransferase